jgi:hypothetical protein
MRPSSVVLALILLLTGCAAPGSTGTSTPTTATATETVEPSASATASPDVTPDDRTRPIFQNEALATVRVNGLEVRTDRGTAAPVLDDIYAGGNKVRLDAGDHVLVLSNALWADGMWWVKIATGRHMIVGFVAAGTRADPWVEEDNAWCPGAGPSLATLANLSGIEALGCYASIPLTFMAYPATVPPGVGFGGACEPPPTYPAWLVCDNINYNWVNRDGGYAAELLLHFDPATGIPPTGLATEGSVNPQLQITGHFDDPAAEACAPIPPTTREEVAAWLTCRTLFVVEQIN